jgi:hypothetical protein
VKLTYSYCLSGTNITGNNIIFDSQYLVINRVDRISTNCRLDSLETTPIRSRSFCGASALKRHSRSAHLTVATDNAAAATGEAGALTSGAGASASAISATSTASAADSAAGSAAGNAAGSAGERVGQFLVGRATWEDALPRATAENVLELPLVNHHIWKYSLYERATADPVIRMTDITIEILISSWALMSVVSCCF